jgi:hypothetical protein
MLPIQPRRTQFIYFISYITTIPFYISNNTLILPIQPMNIIESFICMPLKKLVVTCVPLESLFAPLCHRLVSPMPFRPRFVSVFPFGSPDIRRRTGEMLILPFERL